MKRTLRCASIFAGVLLITFLLGSASSARAAQLPQGCPPLDRPDAPTAVIGNGDVKALVLLPDAQKGYYRGTRFDWSGAIWCLTYKQHNYFGLWMGKESKMKDPISGPVEDYRAADDRTATGYEKAKPGELFIKPGIGALQRVDEKPYSFNTAYPIVDGGAWSVRTARNAVTFRQTLKPHNGYAYVYQKCLKLVSGQPVLLVEHVLKNTGTEPLDIQVYNHDFFVFDDTTIGPGTTLRFPFVPVSAKPLENGARIDGKSIVFDQPVKSAKGANELTGFSANASDFDFVVENTSSGVGVQETGDQPLSKLVFWANQLTACPEAYVHMQIAPGKTGRWTIRYRFFAR